MKQTKENEFANKQIITHWIREDLKHYFPKFKADVVYEVDLCVAYVGGAAVGPVVDDVVAKIDDPVGMVLMA